MEQNEILQATDALLAIHDLWIAKPDPTMGEIPPREFEDAAENLFTMVGTADVPANCRELVRAIEEFEAQWRLYVNGARERNGNPKNALWSTLRTVIAARQITSELRPKQLEPVHELLRQGVSPRQIAHNMYGYAGKGPFLDESGNILFDKIQQEAKEPGSVVKPDWLPPYEEARLRKHHVLGQNRLGALDTKIRNNAPAPAQSIDALLREGQYVDVIAKVCKTTEEKVLAVAKILEIEPQYRPNIAGADRAPGEPQIAPTDAGAIEAYANNPAQTPEAQKIRLPKGTTQKVLDMFEAGLGAPEIAERIGGGITPQAVVGIIRKSRQTAG
jgi:hypothetical protein